MILQEQVKKFVFCGKKIQKPIDKRHYVCYTVYRLISTDIYKLDSIYIFEQEVLHEDNH